jgi:hypothetical protein
MLLMELYWSPVTKRTIGGRFAIIPADSTLGGNKRFYCLELTNWLDCFVLQLPIPTLELSSDRRENSVLKLQS